MEEAIGSKAYREAVEVVGSEVEDRELTVALKLEPIVDVVLEFVGVVLAVGVMLGGAKVV